MVKLNLFRFLIRASNIRYDHTGWSNKINAFIPSALLWINCDADESSVEKVNDAVLACMWRWALFLWS